MGARHTPGSRVRGPLPTVLALLCGLVPGSAGAVAPDHRELERQVDALLVLREAGRALQRAGEREGAFPALEGWPSLRAGVLEPAGLSGLAGTDPWGHPWLLGISENRRCFLLASGGADGLLQNDLEGLVESLARGASAPHLALDDPGADLVFAGSLDPWCAKVCGFLRSPSWAGRRWGETPSAPPAPRDRLCLAGEAAGTWLSLRDGPGVREREIERLTTEEGPVTPLGEVRARGHELWLEVESTAGPGWVRARFLGPCSPDEGRQADAPEAYEVDRVLGREVRSLTSDSAAPGGRLFPGAVPLPESARTALTAPRWAFDPPAELPGIGPARPLRDTRSGLVLFFGRVEGEVRLLAVETREPS